MPRPRVDPDQLQSLLSSGMNQADAARYFGVSEAAISLRVKQLQIATSKVIAMERAATVVDQKLTAADRLAHIQRVILEQIAWAEDQAKAPNADRPAFVDTLVKLCAEVRGQIRLQHDLTRTLIDLQVVREFPKTVFEEISKESPEVARRIVARLKERQALRRSVEVPTLDGREGFDVA